MIQQSRNRQIETQVNSRVGSVNRNFIDTMSAIMGMDEKQQTVLNLRASA